MDIPFKDFDEKGVVRIYQHGILPHWRQSGCTYFVTFRQADSIPADKRINLKEIRSNWLKRHGIEVDAIEWKRKFASLGKPERREYEQLIGIRLDEYLDAGYGSCVLSMPSVASLISNALRHFDGDRVYLGDFVIMPNHVHVLMQPSGEFELEDVLHSLKSFTSNKINRLIKKEGPFWQKESYDHVVRDFEQLEAFQSYIQKNPVKACLSKDRFTYQSAKFNQT